MITITVQAANVGELHATLRALLNDQQVVQQQVVLGPLTRDQAQEIAKVAQDIPAVTKITTVEMDEASTQPIDQEQTANVLEGVKPKRTRRTKAEMEAAKKSNGATDHAPEVTAQATVQPMAFTQPSVAASTTADIAPAAPAVAPVSGAVTKEQVHQALQQVNVAVGLPKAREILASFKVNRISEIKEDQYKPFVQACNDAVASQG